MHSPEMELFYLLFGTTNVVHLIAGALMALFGWLVSVVLHVLNGVKKNPDSPNRFSFWYLWDNGINKMALGLFFTATAMRFSAEITGGELTMYLSFLYGFLNYQLGVVLLRLRNRFLQDKAHDTP